LAYRVGSHGQFKAAMLMDLSRHKDLRGLTVRDDEDFSIALLDSWAVSCDVLSFYQERIAHEGYLRTAKERLSLLQLARLMGYGLSPGVAAGTYLAFTIEDPLNPETPAIIESTRFTGAHTPKPITVDRGTRVQSIPGQDELPQTFETLEKIEVRKEWNALKPRLSDSHTLFSKTEILYFKGVTTQMEQGNVLCFDLDGNGGTGVCIVGNIMPDANQDYTKTPISILMQGIDRFPNPDAANSPDPLDYNEPFKQLIDLENPINDLLLTAEAQAQKIQVKELFSQREAFRPPAPKVTVFRNSASIFGHNAPAWIALPYTLRIGVLTYPNGTEKKGVLEKGPLNGEENNWVDSPGIGIYEDVEGTNHIYIYLDSSYPKILKNSWVLIKDDSHCQLYQVVDTTDMTMTRYTLSAKVTRLTLNKGTGNSNLTEFNIRNTTVYIQGEELPLARMPIETPITGKEIKLKGWIEGFYPGQNIIISGESCQSRGNQTCETATIHEVRHDLGYDGGTEIILNKELENSFVRRTLTINANVAFATHGESVTEVLGSGDAGQVFQKFYLRQNPLTYISSSKPGGVESTLEVRVNDLLWQEVPSFYNRGPHERIYISRLDNEGKTYVMFGDGITGTRLPSGMENVTAAYRKGIGMDGLVNPGQLSLLASRPYGVKEVVNPLAPAGAADPETLDQARKNCPLTVLTLDRVVSLSDFEDFSRAFAGIEKARADWVWDGHSRLVYLTVAGAKGSDIDPGTALYKNLHTAIENSGTGRQAFCIQSYIPLSFCLAAGIKINTRYIKEKVLKQVKSTLESQFSFDSRSLGQPVTKSEVLALMQSVPGVEAVDMDALHLSGESHEEKMDMDYLTARKGRWDPEAQSTAPAELLTISPKGITLTEMA